MKKFIAFTSIGLSVGFAIALANAQDTSSSHSSQPGTAETSSSDKTTDTTRSDTSSASNPSDTNTQTTSRTTETKLSKSCTDDRGVTYRQGQKGFKDCMQTMEKSDSSS